MSVSAPGGRPPPLPVGAERRTERRVNVRLSAEILHDGRPITVRTRNLSISGVALDLDEPLPDDAEVDLSLFVVSDDVEDSTVQPVQLRGIVAWVVAPEQPGPAKIGLRFDGLSAAQLSAVTRLMKLAGD